MTQGIHHLGLTVNSLEEGRAFFVDLLGWKVVREDFSYPSLFVGNEFTIVTLWMATADSVLAFDRKSNIGLHHFAISVPFETELKQIFEKLSVSKFEIESPPVKLREGPAIHFFVSGPSGIRIEFVHIPD